MTQGQYNTVWLGGGYKEGLPSTGSVVGLAAPNDDTAFRNQETYGKLRHLPLS